MIKMETKKQNRDLKLERNLRYFFYVLCGLLATIALYQTGLFH